MRRVLPKSDITSGVEVPRTDLNAAMAPTVIKGVTAGLQSRPWPLCVCEIARSRQDLALGVSEGVDVGRIHGRYRLLPSWNFFPCLGPCAAPRRGSGPHSHQGGDRWVAKQALVPLRLRNGKISSRSSVGRVRRARCETNSRTIFVFLASNRFLVPRTSCLRL